MTARSLPPAVPAAWLRVYEPLEAFTGPERAYWTAYVQRPASQGRAEALEREAVWRRLLATDGDADPLAPEPLIDPGLLEPDADPADRHGAAAATAPGSPASDPGVRAALAPDRTVGAGPEPGVGPEKGPEPGPEPGPAPSAGRAEARVLRLGGGPLVCPVLSGERAQVRAWTLASEWLTLAEPDDARTPGEPGSWVVPMSAARTRAARVLRTLRRTFGEVPAADRMAWTARWLEGFHPRSGVEIDVRSVVAVLGEDGYEDARLGLRALADGDLSLVAAVNRRVRRREEILRELSRSS